jgi:hypothetical protein
VGGVRLRGGVGLAWSEGRSGTEWGKGGTGGKGVGLVHGQIRSKDTLEKVQEKAVKMVAGLKGSTYLEKCAELGPGDAGEEEGGPGHGSGLQICEQERRTDVVQPAE